MTATEDVAHQEGNKELEATDVVAPNGAHYYGYLCNFSSSQWYKLDDHDVDVVEENEVLADARDKVCMLHYVRFGSVEYESCQQMDTLLFPTPEHNLTLSADDPEHKVVDNSKSEPVISVADHPHGASKPACPPDAPSAPSEVPHEEAACPPAAAQLAAPSAPATLPKFSREEYLESIAQWYPSMNMGYLRSHMVLDEDWLVKRDNAAVKARRAVEALIEAKKLVLPSCQDIDKSYDSDGNSVSSIASYMQKKAEKTKLDKNDAEFFMHLRSCFPLYFAFDTRDVSKSYCPFAKFNQTWRERFSLESILEGMECNGTEFTADGLRDHISQCHSKTWCGIGLKFFLHELYPHPKTASKEATSKQNNRSKKNSKLTYSQLTPPVE